MAQGGIRMIVTGDAELRRRIRRMRSIATGEILETAVTAGALLVANRAKQLAAFETGTLRRSLHVGGHTELAPGFDAGEGYGDIGGAIRGTHSASVDVGTDVPYAKRIEFGFIGPDSSGRTYHQPPRPYLRPAIDETRDDVAREIGEVLRDQLRRVARP